MSGTENITAARYDSVSGYSRAALQADIVHIGFGAFHRGHQALYTDLANEAADNAWGIFEINLFGTSDLIDQLNKQDGLFSLLETSSSAQTSHLIRSVTGGLHTPECGVHAAIDKLLEPQVKIVSLTITEKGYCINPQTRTLDFAHPLIVHDLANAQSPSSAIALLVAALGQRKARGLPPFSILSCDNMPDNGQITHNAVVAFATRLDPDLGQWIAENVTFPATMVDRIVPAMTQAQFAMLRKATSYADPCGIVCEDFRQWVIEDNFVRGRPDWNLAGAMFVADVRPYEEMKLRMLNGSHSFLAYNGSLAGYEFIDQCMADPVLRSATRHLMVNEQAQTLSPQLDIDPQQYADLLLARFSNHNVKHRTAQIAMDGSQKLPQRAITSWRKLHQQNKSNAALSLLIAGWLHYVIGQLARHEDINDPLAAQFQQAIVGAPSLWNKAQALLSIDIIFGEMSNSAHFIAEIQKAFMHIETAGIQKTLNALLSGNPL